MRKIRTAVTAALATGTLLVGAVPGHADTGPRSPATIGERETVCADSLNVRTGPSDGAFKGTLNWGETFTVTGRQGDYVSGFAYGHINSEGWVQDGWFC